MQKAVVLAKKISEDPSKSWTEEMEDLNLWTLFKPIYKGHQEFEIPNAIVAFIIFAYDNDSGWLNLHQDRLQNKMRIWKGIKIKMLPQLERVAKNDDDSVNEVIVEYLIEQTTWEWNHIMTLLDYHSNMIRFVRQKTETEKSTDKLTKDDQKITMTEEYDIEKIGNTNKTKGDLLKKAIEARQQADELLRKIKKDFVQMDNAVQQDFGFSPTDEKKVDIMSWRHFLQYTVLPEKERRRKEGI
jgi:flagellar biosynthesis/type III secretory pathway chaperone